MEQLKRAMDFGLKIPHTFFDNKRPITLRAFFQEMCGQIIAKPLRKNYFIREIERLVIFTNKISKSDTEEDSAIEATPVIYQELIKKKTRHQGEYFRRGDNLHFYRR